LNIIIMYINTIPEAAMTSMSQVVPHLYIKTMFKCGHKLYNRLLENIKRLHTLNNFKKELKSIFCKMLFIPQKNTYRQHCSSCVYWELG